MFQERAGDTKKEQHRRTVETSVRISLETSRLTRNKKLKPSETPSCEILGYMWLAILFERFQNIC
jgi:hypothetical protein